MAEVIRRAVGATFDVELDGVPTAGYRWTFTGADPAGGVVEPVADERVPGGSVGGSARQRFTFRAVAPGAVVLTFAYGRRWEPEPRRVERVEVRVG